MKAMELAISQKDCRAHETELDDPFVRDPFAARLPGERGLAILRGVPHSAMVRLGLAIRTRFVDELLLEALRTYSITTVLSVGCGLDTRPWRLNLASNLRWIEIDFADVLDYKDRLMTGETPTCRRERLTVDLNDSGQRRAMYGRPRPCVDDHIRLTPVPAGRHGGSSSGTETPNPATVRYRFTKAIARKAGQASAAARTRKASEKTPA
jgi:leucine carboxyl methyltransferase